MIKLHTWTTPNGWKVSIALEELGVPYEVHPVNLTKNEQLQPAFLKLNPNHKIPVIEDDGQVIWESGAILLHLGEKHDKKGVILPKDARKRMEVIQYAFFQTGGVGPNLGRLGAARRKEGEKNQEMITIFSDEMARLYGVIDRILADGREYLAGDYSIGDVMHYPWLHFVLNLKAPDLMKLPRVVAWLERIGSRPAVKRGLEIPKV